MKTIRIKNIEITLHTPSKNSWYFSLMPNVVFDYDKNDDFNYNIAIMFMCFAITIYW